MKIEKWTEIAEKLTLIYQIQSRNHQQCRDRSSLDNSGTSTFCKPTSKTRNGPRKTSKNLLIYTSCIATNGRKSPITLKTCKNFLYQETAFSLRTSFILVSERALEISILWFSPFLAKAGKNLTSTWLLNSLIVQPTNLISQKKVL